jgi:prolyl oligopeptidase
MRRTVLLSVSLVTGLALVSCPGPTNNGTQRRGADPDGRRAVPPPVTRKPQPVTPKRVGPPLARRQKVVDVLHGVQVPDPYRWLENEKSAEVKAWVKRMDGYARPRLAKLPGHGRLTKRLAELGYVEWTGAPLRRGERYFYARRHKDKEKVVHYWRQGLGGKPKVLLDANTMSKDGSVSVKGLSVDFQGRRLAYKISRNNADESTLQVMDIRTGRVSAVDSIPGVKYAHPSWTPNGDGFYYTRLPMDKTIPTKDRPGYAAVYFHRIGTSYKTDKLIHAKTGDPKTFIFPYVSRDGGYLFIYIEHGWKRTDLYIKALHRGRLAKFVKVTSDKDALYQIYVWEGQIYLHTNEGAPRYRLFRIHPRKLGRQHWKEIVPEQKDAVLKSFAIRGNRLSLQYMRNASTELRIATLKGKVLRKVSFPGIGTASQLTGNAEDDTAYYSFSSFIRPSTVYRTSMKKGGRSVYFQMKLPIDPAPYAVKQVFYASKDGTKVSMFILHRKSMRLDGKTPTLLYGYGGFNVNILPRFRSSYFVWLEQGGAVAIPNLRGGGEYGEDWHRGGMLLKKQNTFDDFIYAAKYLIKHRYTSSSKLAIRGGSNGGLLVGALMVQQPDLVRVVACHVPLLDMVRYHKFGSGMTWIGEYGSADDPAQFKAIHAYSPYHHVRKGTRYPALLMLSADSDDRVDPMHARKFVAAIRWATTSPLPVLLRVEVKSGHGGGDMVKKRVARTADEYAFLLKELGVTPK